MLATATALHTSSSRPSLSTPTPPTPPPTPAAASLLASYHKLEREKTKDKYFDARKQSESDFKELTQEVVDLFGTRNTRWERLYDEEARTTYVYNWKNGKTLGGNPAICEVCDEEIEEVDFKCFNCNTLRSNVNQPKYKGRTPLEDLMQVTYLDQGKKHEVVSLGKADNDDDHEFAEDEEGQAGMMGVLRSKTRTFKRTWRKSKGGEMMRTFRKTLGKSGGAE